MSSDLSLLLCGRPDSESELGEILLHIGKTLDTIMARIGPLLKNSEEEISLYGPFLGRSLLELGCTALIGRLDPFRVLLLRELQIKPTYELGSRHKLSIQWQGDVLAGKRVANLWADKDMTKVTRALVGDYYEQVFWQRSVEKILQKGEALPDNPKWVEQLEEIGVKGFGAWARDELSQLYSSLSKGLHHEFVISPGKLFDRRAVTDLINRSLNVISLLGLVINSILHIPFAIPLDDAIQIYDNLYKMEFS